VGEIVERLADLETAGAEGATAADTGAADGLTELDSAVDTAVASVQGEPEPARAGRDG
jgi:hypothetical protein